MYELLIDPQPGDGPLPSRIAALQYSCLQQVSKLTFLCREPPEEGLMCELLWSDPQPGVGRAPSKRGVGVAFGADVTQRFLEDNGLQLLVRSHEVRLTVR